MIEAIIAAKILAVCIAIAVSCTPSVWFPNRKRRY